MILFILFTSIKSNAQTKRALIIAIENYPAESGWKTLNTLGDAVLLQNTLLNQGFLAGNIKILTDSQATLKGIDDAFERLITNAGPGDNIVIHFSSHGVQIEDDNIDEEVDGLDESIVPFDAIYSSNVTIFDKIAAGYFRDDVFGNKISRLRNKIGAAGNVLVIIDACHSGTATRGDGPKVRGSMPAIVSANFNKKKASIKDSAGVFKDRDMTLNDDAASYIVISAAQATEDNKEIYDDDGISVVGSLSYAVSKTLNTLDEKITYRSLFARIENILLEKVPNQKPALEGDGIDREVFGGQYKLQQTYFTGTVDKTNKKIVSLDGGTVSGITKGSIINFYPAGTENSDGKKPVATGTVTAAKYFTSTVTLSKSNPSTGNKLYAFVSQLAYGTKKIKLGVDSLSKEELVTLKASLKNYQLAELIKPPYDLYFGKSMQPGNVWALRNTETREIFADSITLENPNQLKKVLKRFDRYRYLRNLEFNMPDLTAKIMLVLVDDKGVIDVKKTEQRTKLGVLEIQHGDLVRPLIINTSKSSFYVNIVDIQPDGIIQPIIPNKKLKDLNKNNAPIKWSDCLVAPGDTLKVTSKQGFAIRISPPYGEETFKIFISKNPLDLEEILTTNGTSDINSRGAGNQLNNLVKIFKDSEVNELGSRGGPTINMDKDGTIKNLNFRIVPKQ